MAVDENQLAKRNDYSLFSLINEFDRIFDDFRKGFDNLFFEPRLMTM
ncbi:MAG: hypothetical protein ACTSR3_16915 [Candidatus Helarchaeota archaeon]